MSEDSREDILRYIEKHGVVDKDSRGTRRGSRRARSRAVTRAGQRTVDLHGLTSDRADHVLRQALQGCRRDGVKSLLVIHGQGLHSPTDEGSVLGRLVADRVTGAYAHFVRDHKKAPPAQGGDGATILFL